MIDPFRIQVDDYVIWRNAKRICKFGQVKSRSIDSRGRLWVLVEWDTGQTSSTLADGLRKASPFHLLGLQADKDLPEEEEEHDDG